MQGVLGEDDPRNMQCRFHYLHVVHDFMKMQLSTNNLVY